MSETALSRAIAKALDAMGYTHLRIHSGAVRVKRGFMQLAPKGTPDRLVLLASGRCCWLEIKLPGEKPSEAQELWHRRARVLGHTVAVVRSVPEAIAAVQGAEDWPHDVVAKREGAA